MVPTVNEIKRSLYLEHEADDDLLAMYLLVSKEFIYQQTGFNYDTESSVLVKQVIILHVSHLYEQRLPTAKDAGKAVPHAMDAMLRMIRFREGSDC